MRRVHFIYLGGEFLWQHWRAIETARVHEADETTIWCAEPLPATDEFGYPVVRKKLRMSSWLRDHPIQLANVKDFFLWRILGDVGGLYLDLDTISLQPVWDLLEQDLLVSSEWSEGFTEGHPYNSAVCAGRAGAPIFAELEERAAALLVGGASRWGTVGPHLLTDVVPLYADHVDAAPFGVLNGYRDGTISRYYAGDRPDDETRVLHLFSSSNMDAFRADRWIPDLVAA